MWHHCGQCDREVNPFSSRTGAEVAGMDLVVTTSVVSNKSIAAVSGEIDVYTAPELREKLVGLVDSGATDIVVDMGQVGFCDSTGLGALVAALNYARDRDTVLSLAAAQERVLKVLRITGLDQVFTVYPSVAAATE
jgi:anti-sigma B factor antagonist